MKPNLPIRMLLVVAGIALLGASRGQAATYYWDSDGTTSGLGNTAGTWGTSTYWATIPGGILAGTAATSNPVTAAGDTVYFGTNNLTLGSTASTIGIAGGGVTIGNIVFGAGQTSPVILSGGGGSITLAGGTSTITVNNTSDTIAAVIDGNAGFTKAGSGTLILSAANTIIGGVNINGGTLQIGDGISGSLAQQDVTFNAGGGVLNVVGATTGGTTQDLGYLTLYGGDGTVQSTYGGNGTSVTTLSFSEVVTNLGTTVNFKTSGGNSTNNRITTSGSIASFTDAYLYKSIFFNGTSYAAYDSAGFMRAVGAGDADFVAVGAGADMGVVASTNTVLLSGSLSAQGASSVSSINLAANNITMSGGASLLQTDGLLSSGSSNAVISGGQLQTTTASNDLVIRVNDSVDQLSIHSNIQNNGGSSLTKSGAGTLVLAGVNTYTGTTTINAGTLAVSSGHGIADSGSVSLADAVGAKFRLDANETIYNLYGGGFSGGNVDVQGNLLTIVNASAYGGRISGTSSGGVVVSSGHLALGNKNTFAGTITLSENAQLSFTHGNDGTASALTVSSGGTIRMSNGSTLLLNPTAQVAAGVAGSSINSSSGSIGITNSIVVTSGVATLKHGAGGDAKYVFGGSVTGGASGHQTLSILQGALGGNGERTDILLSGVIQNGSGGTLGLNLDFQGASSPNQGAAINLSGQNTFTGPLVISNTKNLTYNTSATYQGGWVAIGGENSYNGSTRVATAGTGYLGGGNYTNTITLAKGIVLDYLSSSNQILAGSISGAGNLVKEGSGTLTLSAANTFSGTTTIGAGKIVMGHVLALQNSAYVTTGSNGSTIGLDVTSGVDSGTLTLGGLGGAVNLASAITAGYTGSVTNLTLNPQAGATNTYTGIIANGSGAMTLTKTGLGTQILSNTNTYTGGTNVNAGTLQLSGAFNMPGTGVLAVNAGGTFSLADGAARTTTANGGLSLASGSTLLFDWKTGAADSLTTTANVTPVSGAIIGIGINVSTPSGGPYTLISGGASSTLNNASYYLTNTTNYTATLTKAATTLTIGSYASATALTSIYWTGNKLAGTNTSGVDNALAFSSGAATNWSSSPLNYTATGLIPGTTADVFFSKVQVGKTQQSTVLGANLSMLSLTIDDAVAVTIGGSNTLTLLSTSTAVGSVNQTSGVGSTGKSAITVTSNAANPTISANVMLGASQTWNVATGKTLTVSGNIDGITSTTTLSKASAGTLLLSGANTFSGGLIINAGTVLLGSAGALNNASNQENAVTFGSGSTGVLALAGNSITLASLNTNAVTPGTPIVQNANGSSVGNAVLTVGNDLNLGGTYEGAISDGSGGGTLTLIKSGLGTLVLSGATSDYTGATTIKAGTLAVSTLADGGSNSGIGASTNAADNLILNGGTLQYTGAATSTDRLFSLQSNSTIDASGSGAVNFTHTGSMGFNGSVAAKTLTLAGSNTDSNTLAAVIGDNTGATSVIKSGVGTWVLSGANTYTGSTTVSGGTLVVNGSLAGSSVVVNGSLGGSGRMINATLSGTGSINPGNSPGVMTARAVDPGLGTDFNFEFSSANTLPLWNNASASVNDVLRLADATAPVTAAMTSTNLISIFLNVGALASGDVFTGGIFTDRNASFLDWIAGAHFQYYLADAGGTTTYNGSTYDLYDGPYGFRIETVAQTADFGSGDVSGHVTRISVADNPYLAWANGGGAFGNDDNGDGLPNGLAWMLGARNPNENARSRLPDVVINSGDIHLQFRVLHSASRGTASIKVQYSKDLGVTDPWASHQADVPDVSSTVNGIVFTVAADGNYNVVTAKVPVSGAGAGKKLFTRLVSSMP